MMNTVIRIALVGALTMVLGACSTVSYVSDRDTQVDFSGFESFAWFELPSKAGSDRPHPTRNAILAARIQRAVTAELSRRGLGAEATAGADLLVTYDIAIRQGMRVYHSGWGHPYHGFWWGAGGWGGAYHSARVVTQGTLIVDVLDSSSRRLVWRGVAEGAFNRPNPSDEKVAEIVAELMLSFPVS